MKARVFATLGILASILLAACSPIEPALQREIGSAIERGAEERPPRITQETHPSVTPVTSPAFESSPQPTAATPSGLTTLGPWLLLCGQDDKAALMDVNGPGRHFPGVPCLPENQISGSAGFAIGNEGLIQFPGGQEVRDACCRTAGWSADGNLALLSSAGISRDGSELLLYDVNADRFLEIVSSDNQLTPMGLSPGGTWAVYLDYDEFSRSRLPPAKVMAISTDGQRMWNLYGLYGDEVQNDRVLGWLSDSYLLIEHLNETCNLEPQHSELMVVNLNLGSVRHIFDKHSYVAFDPVTQTIMLEELPLGPCALGQRGPLVRLSALDGWEPHAVPLPAEWGDEWAISQIQWHPELGQFSVRVGENGGGAPVHLVTLNPDGTIAHEFPMDGVQIATSPRLFPSSDGSWILVAGSAPHGTRLYDRDGRLVKVLKMEDGQELSYGVRNVLWLPEEDVFFMTDPESPGMFRASARQGWEPTLVEPRAASGSTLMLIEPPEHPFVEACGGAAFTRLQTGDKVMVSYEPASSIRLRDGPGLAETELGQLAPGDSAEITDGPVCADGYVWWKLRAEGVSVRGWAAEGDAQGAWLLPLGISGGPAPLPTTLSQVAGPTPTPGPQPSRTPSPSTEATLSARGPWLIGAKGYDVLVVDADGSFSSGEWSIICSIRIGFRSLLQTDGGWSSYIPATIPASRCTQPVGIWSTRMWDPKCWISSGSATRAASSRTPWEPACGSSHLRSKATRS